MTYPQELQDYYDAHERMMDSERWKETNKWWGWLNGEYKVARYNAVKAGYLPEQPEFG